MPPEQTSNTQAHHPTKRTPLRAVADLFSIRYHARRLKEDLAATKAALERRKALNEGVATADELPDIFRGKMMGVFFATGWTNLIGIFIGGILQFRTGNPLIGLYSTPPLCFLITGIAFQIGWWADNKKIYSRYHKDPFHQFLQLQKDMWPVHRAALPIAIGFSLLNYIILTPLYSVLTWINPGLAKNTPAGALIMAIEFLFIGGTFVRLMGDFFDRHGYTLAAKYRDICIEKS